MQSKRKIMKESNQFFYSQEKSLTVVVAIDAFSHVKPIIHRL